MEEERRDREHEKEEKTMIMQYVVHTLQIFRLAMNLHIYLPSMLASLLVCFIGLYKMHQYL